MWRYLKMNGREQDIQNLCKQVLEECYPNYDPNRGLDSCPFCGNDIHERSSVDSMKAITHDKECAYLIAKDLSTGFNAT